MTIEDDIAFLGRIPTFAKFGFAALQIIAIGSEAKQLADGETLFQEGETTEAGYVVQEGALRLVTSDLAPSEPAATFGPGTLIGELALVTETVWAATAIADEPTMVIRISRNLFRKVLEGFPEAARLMRDRLVARANRANGELMRIRAMLEQQVKTAPARNPPLNGPPAGDIRPGPLPGRARR